MAALLSPVIGDGIAPTCSISARVRAYFLLQKHLLLLLFLPLPAHSAVLRANTVKARDEATYKSAASVANESGEQIHSRRSFNEQIHLRASQEQVASSLKPTSKRTGVVGTIN